MFSQETVIGIVGAGSMGAGIAQVAATAGHSVILFDSDQAALARAKKSLSATLEKLQDKGKIPDAGAILHKFTFAIDLNDFAACGLIIEAIVENLAVKKAVFSAIEKIVGEDCVLASNTSSLSITSIAASCERPERVLGLHFFNPAPLMALVEVIPAVQTRDTLIQEAWKLMDAWKKVPVVAKDTPGFIVNRLARPFYGEALRIYDEGIAGLTAIDQAMSGPGRFPMGPFTLMDYIGHDVNYVVTETVFQSFFYDPRYKPSLTQKRLLEAGWLGKKTGRGFYTYAEGKAIPEAPGDGAPSEQIFERILAMLINEAVEALYLRIASAADLDLAMTKGVNYPKGLLQWCDELGAGKVLGILDGLYGEYHEDRYRASALLRKAAASGQKFR